MGKKVSIKTTSKKKKKSWWTFFFFFAIAGIIAIPVAAKVTFPDDQMGEVAGVSSSASGSGEFREKMPCPTVTTTTVNVSPKPCIPSEGRKLKPPVYLYTITLNRGSCYPGFQSGNYTCSNGTSGTVTFPNSSCVDSQAIQKKAETECIKLGTSPTPTKTQKVSALEYYKKLLQPKSSTTTSPTQ